MTKVGGAAFSLIGFDFAGWTAAEVPFTVHAGRGLPDFQTFTVNGNWTNLSSVVWQHSGAGTTQGLFALGNIRVDTMP